MLRVEGEVPSDQRLRVAIVSHSYVTGDRRNKVRELAQLADVALVTPRVFREPPYARRSAAPGDGAYVVKRFTHLYVNFGFSSTRYLFLTPDLGFRAFRPDIVQVENEIHSFPVMQAALYRRLFAPRARLVVSFWQNQTWDDVRGRALRAMQKRVMPSVDYFLAANADGDRILAEAGVESARRTVLPPAGVDDSIFTPAAENHRRETRSRLGIAPGEYVVGYCGRLVPEKGVLDLVAAMGAMPRDRCPARLLVVGAGPQEAEVRARSREADVPLTVHAPTSPVDVADSLNACDVLVLPSRTTRTWKEQFGRVITEAMACEVPVVGSDSGEIPRVVGNGGCIFPEGDVRALAAILARLRGDCAERRALGTAGRARVEEHFSDRAIARRSMVVYEGLCLQRGSLQVAP